MLFLATFLSVPAHAEPRAAFEAEVFEPARLAKILEHFDQSRVAEKIRLILEKEATDGPPAARRERFVSALAKAINRAEPDTKRAEALLGELREKGFARLSPEARAALVLGFFKHDHWTEGKYTKNEAETMALLPLKETADPVFRGLTWSPDVGQLEFRTLEPVSLPAFEASLRRFCELLEIPFDEITSRRHGVEAVHFHVSHDARRNVETVARGYHVLIALRVAQRGRSPEYHGTAYTRDARMRGHLRYMADKSDLSHNELRKHWGTPMEEIREWFAIAQQGDEAALNDVADRIEAELMEIRRKVGAGKLDLNTFFPDPGKEIEEQGRQSFLVDAAVLLSERRAGSPLLAWLLGREEFRDGLARQIAKGEFGPSSELGLRKLVRTLALTEAGLQCLIHAESALRASVASAPAGTCGPALRNMSQLLELARLRHAG